VPALFDERIGIVGGAERYALELARNMSVRTPTRLITFGPADESRNDGDLRVDIIGGARAVRDDSYDMFSPVLFDYLDTADVVHCHQAHATATTMAAEFCRRTQKRVFVTDLGGGPGTGQNRVNEAMFDAFLHISRFSQSLWSDSRVRSLVISGGVDAARFSSADAPPVDFRAIFVGRILPHKGIDVLIDALPDDMQLDVIGQMYDARYFSDLEALARGKSVSFITNSGDDELVKAYQGASVVVLPSVYRTIYGDESFAPELLGQTLLEGMACGLPAVCSDAGAMPEVVVDGVTGFVVPAGNVETLRSKLLWLRDNPATTREMGSAARRHVTRHFSWSAVVDRCLSAYSL